MATGAAGGMSERRVLLVNVWSLTDQQAYMGAELVTSILETLVTGTASGTFVAAAAARYFAFRIGRREAARSRQRGIIVELARGLRAGEAPRNMGRLGGSGR